MAISRLADELRTHLSHSLVSRNVPLRDYTTLRIGGPAAIFVNLASEADAALCFSLAQAEDCPVLILGRGSNLLVCDKGFEGLVLYMGDAFSDIHLLWQGEAALLTAQAGAGLQKLCNAALEASLGGLAFASGIPGTVGGAVAMNAGAYGGEIAHVLESAVLLGRDGVRRTLKTNELHLGYRHSIVTEEEPSPLVLSATFRLQKADPEEIRAQMQDYARRRREKQPIQFPSCGSTFKRPEGYFAGTLIEQCGLKGFRVGGCSVSTLHAGFLLNDQNGSGEDYLRLIREVQRIVFEQTGVRLEPEVRIISQRGREA